jgi:hypothetical protein
MLPSPGIRWWIYRSDFEEMGFFFMPTLLKAKNGLEIHQKLAVWPLCALPDEKIASARATSRLDRPPEDG